MSIQRLDQFKNILMLRVRAVQYIFGVIVETLKESIKAFDDPFFLKYVPE